MKIKTFGDFSKLMMNMVIIFGMLAAILFMLTLSVISSIVISGYAIYLPTLFGILLSVCCVSLGFYGCIKGFVDCGIIKLSDEIPNVKDKDAN